MTVKNRCLYSVTTLGSPDTGRKKVEAKRLAGTLKRKFGLPPSAEIEKEKVSCWTGFVADGTKASTPGRRRQKISRTRRSQVLQASIKNSIKSISP